MKQFIKPLAIVFALLISSSAFGQNHQNYPEFLTFYYASYDNLNKTEQDYLPLFTAALSEAEQISDPQEKLVRTAWANYILSRIYYELDDLDNAEKYCDIAEALSQEARSLNDDEEALLIYVCCVGMNCQLKPFNYLVTSGINVPSLSKKILKKNPQNGHAAFLVYSSDIYAPSPFSNYKKGAQEMLEIINNKNLSIPDEILFDVYCAEAYCLIHGNKKAEAATYLNMAARLFPNNISLIKLQSQL